jgi:hypothetical protein
MELHCNSRCALWWLITDKDTDRQKIAEVWRRITRLQTASGLTAYSVIVFEAAGGLHANILFIGNRTIASKLGSSLSFGPIIQVKRVTNASGLSRAYLAKERTPQAGYGRSMCLGGRLNGSHNVPGGGDRVRLSRRLVPWKAGSYARGGILTLAGQKCGSQHAAPSHHSLPRFKMTETTDHPQIQIHDPSKLKGNLKIIGGSQADDWNNFVANQTIRTLWTQHSTAEQALTDRRAAVDALIGIAPKDELEGMMAAQLIAAHNAAMECYRRAMLGEQTFEGRRENLAQANRLSRTYAALVEALNRHRGKGQQKVTVEHVHVHSGGQAVVGMVGVPGEGDGAKSEDQPHAKQLAHAPQPAVRRPDPERELVPLARDAERALPAARRPVVGCAKR